MLGDKSKKVMTKSQVMLRALRKIKQGRETRAQTAWPGVIWLRSQGRDRDNQGVHAGRAFQAEGLASANLGGKLKMLEEFKKAGVPGADRGRGEWREMGSRALSPRATEKTRCSERRRFDGSGQGYDMI